MTETKMWLTIKDLIRAEWFPITSEYQIKNYIKAGSLNAKRVGNPGKDPEKRKYIIHKDDAIKFITNLEDNSI